MNNELYRRFREIQPKMHGLAAGMTLAFGAALLNQGCSFSGQCPSCGACAIKLPLLALPFLADGAVTLAGNLWSRIEVRKQVDQPASDG